MGKSSLWAASAYVGKLVVPVLLVATSIGKFTGSVHQAERKIVPHHYPPVPVLMLHETKIEARKNRSDIRKTNDQDPALLVTPTISKPGDNTTTRQVVFKEVCEATYLISTKAAGLILVIPQENVPENHACMTTKGIMDDWQVTLSSTPSPTFGR